MKKLSWHFAIYLVSFSFYGQIINFPDANFKNKLLASSTLSEIARNIDGQNIAIDANSDNEISYAEALNVHYLEVNFSGINDLTGIEAFTNLEFLSCYQNNLTDLPVSNLVNLKGLYCWGNTLISLPALETLTLLTDLNFDDNPITAVNLQNLNQLWRLNCSRTLLHEINLRCTAVSWLWCESCSQLQSVSLKNNLLSPGLRQAVVGANSEPPIYTLNFGNTPLLANICYDEGELPAIETSGYNPANVTLTTDCDANCLLAVNQNQVSEFSIHPNPTTSLLNISGNSKILSLKVVNMLGQMVKTIPYSEISESPTVDVSLLKTGTYFLEIHSNAGKTTKKFVKL